LVVWLKNDQNGPKNEVKNDAKNGYRERSETQMLENEVKMHFTYHWQCSAYSNSPSKDLVKLFS
jgi:hypothetical protein